MTAEMYASAITWLERGFELIPCFPNSKMQLTGYGLHSKHVTTAAEAAKLWQDDPRRLNLAVVAPQDKFFILDFDDFDLYLMWSKLVDSKATASYSEMTPGEGMHVFFTGADPKFRLDEKTGRTNFTTHGGSYEERRVLAETKRVVLVAPSMIGGKKYGYEIVNDTKISSGENVLLPLSALCPPEEAPKVRAQFSGGNASKLEQIKAKLDILQLVKACFPEIKLRGDRRYRWARCPFHSGKKLNFWVDTEKNIFGCHGCATRGDVINLYALSKNISNTEAIKALILEWQL